MQNQIQVPKEANMDNNQNNRQSKKPGGISLFIRNFRVEARYTTRVRHTKLRVYSGYGTSPYKGSYTSLDTEWGDGRSVRLVRPPAQLAAGRAGSALPWWRGELPRSSASHDRSKTHRRNFFRISSFTLNRTTKILHLSLSLLLNVDTLTFK